MPVRVEEDPEATIMYYMRYMVGVLRVARVVSVCTVRSIQRYMGAIARMSMV